MRMGRKGEPGIMRLPIAYGIPAVSALLLCGAACSKPAVKVDSAHLRVFGPLPVVMESASNPITDEKVALGRMLYYDTRLSKAQDVSCNTCHPLDRYGAEAAPVSTGHKGLKGNRNAPTVYNAAAHIAQFWDGRAPDVEAQAKGPVLNPVEMAMPNDKAVVAVIKSIPGYVQEFRRAFPGSKDPVTLDNMAAAIGAFERKLITPARWDKFLAGDEMALTNEEKAGLNTFLDSGCQTCHAGPYVGGQLYQKLGAAQPWPDPSDPGRYNVTKSESDRQVFKVPSLRNIAATAPYFHDGKVATLQEAVAKMSEYQLGRKLTDAQAQSIMTWLKTLTGEIPASYIKAPELPPSGPKTPKRA